MLVPCFTGTLVEVPSEVAGGLAVAVAVERRTAMHD